MKPEEFDPILSHRSPRADAALSAASVERARATLLCGLQPVKPLLPASAYTVLFLALFVGVSGLTATVLGLHGIHVLKGTTAAAIFAALPVAAWLASLAGARAMRPAAGRNLGVLSLLLASTLLPAVFAILFRGYGTLNFVHEGIPCLRAGLCIALPTATIQFFILRRGFILEWAEAGLASGVLAGLTGLAMLELHCPNLKAIHILTWHVGVVISSSLLGWLIGRILHLFERWH